MASSGFSGTGAGLGLAQFGMSFLQSQNMRSAGAYQEKIAEFNAKMAERQADRVIELGIKESGKARKAGAQVLGSQRVSLANQGLDLNTGSALAVQQETLEASADDARTIENNAFMEAMGLRYEALTQRQQGRMANIGANFEADMSLVNGGLQGALTYQRVSSGK